MLPAKVANHLPESMAKDQQSPDWKEDGETDKQEDAQDILLLFRLLLNNPPPDHDCKTCPIYRRYGITRL